MCGSVTDRAVSEGVRRWVSGYALVLGVAIGAAAGMAPVAAADDAADVRYDPSPPAVVERMLEMVDAVSAETLYDLGSGDGRIVVAAARDFGVERAIGVEIDADLVARSRERARAAGVDDRARFVQADLFEYDFSDADAVTLFLLPQLNRRLRPRLLAELEPGTRVVSHEHRMGDWRPDDTDRVDGHAIYRWTIPARLEGRWVWRAQGTRYELALAQHYQRLSGMLRADDRRAPVQRARVRGRHVEWRATTADGATLRFDGRVHGDTLEGALVVGERVLPVQARRSE